MKRSLVFLLILLLLPLPASHAQEEIPAAYTSRTKVASGYFATVSVLCLFDDYEDPAANSRLEETWQQVKAILEEIEQTVSASVPTSEIARFNALPQGGRLSVSPLTAELVELSRDMCQRTGGLYDPTVYPAGGPVGLLAPIYLRRRNTPALRPPARGWNPAPAG